MSMANSSENVQKVWDPESVEEIAGANFFFAVILSEVQEFEDVGVPWFNVDRKSSGSLVATLIDITGRGVVGTKHGHNTVRVSVRASNVGAKMT